MDTKQENGKHYKQVQGQWVEYQPSKQKQTKPTFETIKDNLEVTVRIGDTTYSGMARLVKFPERGLGYAVKLNPDQDIFGGASLFIR